MAASVDSRPPALIPVNRLDRAKGRLSGLLTPDERRELALSTFATVVAAVRAAGWRPVVLTSDPGVRAASPEDALLLDELGAFLGLNAELEGAFLRLQPAFPQANDARLLIIHADLPLATGDAIRELEMAAAPAPSATLVRSADGGTNAMLLRPPGLFALAYGKGSFEKHWAASGAAGLRRVAVESPGLALDLDTPDDLLTLLAMPSAAHTPAARLLRGWKIRERIAAANPTANG